ncbi:MAG: SAM-dependent methyltransferase [Candidatus Polarisedimenticolia bacterium]
MTDTSSVSRHYGAQDPAEIILSVLRSSGKDTERLTPDDLAPLDEFHLRGREATREMAALLRLGPADRVLDVGCGMGGPARFLASAFGCRVTGLDLTEPFCRAAERLTRLTGLEGKVEFRQGDALAMPFPDGGFDLVWSQHMNMNVADKARLFGEMRRVTRDGGRLAFYEIAAGPGGAPHFPVPWAPEPSISHLASPEALRAGLEGAGFRVASWEDVTGKAKDWIRRLFEAAAPAGARGDAGVPPHLLLLPEMRPKAANVKRSLDEDRVRVVQAVLEAGR